MSLCGSEPVVGIQGLSCPCTLVTGLLFTPKPARTMGHYKGKVDAFVLQLGIVAPIDPPFSKIVESTLHGMKPIAQSS